jgi:hypothetical protein
MRSGMGREGENLERQIGCEGEVRGRLKKEGSKGYIRYSL